MKYFKNTLPPHELIAQSDGLPVLQNWEEISQEEYYGLTGSTPTPPQELLEVDPLEELQKENKMLKAQLQAHVDRSDFIEDCIAEMATVVYGDV